MRPAALAYIACPRCRAGLRLDARETAGDGHVEDGTLTCVGCPATYPIAGGVPRLVPGAAVERAAVQTAGRFGKQWKIFAEVSEVHEDWFRGWIAPLGPEDFRGRVVFEGGCGKGRHTVIAAAWGAKAVVALDLGEAIEVAFAHTRHLENVHVVQGDLLHPPAPRVFDVAFSIGVLHHLPDPRAGFEALRALVKPSGRVAIWVYGYESNEWIVKFVNPVRTAVTARMPPRLLYWLTLPPSAALAGVTRAFRSERLAAAVPQGAYLQRLSRLPLREVHNIVYDQLVTPIAYYLREDEIRAWFDRPDLADVQITWYHRYSWRGCATVTASSGG